MGGNPLMIAKERGLVDGSEVLVRQGFVRSLDDELGESQSGVIHFPHIRLIVDLGLK